MGDAMVLSEITASGMGSLSIDVVSKLDNLKEE